MRRHFIIQCPIPNAQCPMPNAQFPMPNAPCPIPIFQAGLLYSIVKVLRQRKHGLAASRR
ncbi:hypothetical protein H6G81_09250 [Scytonema hofmannii FACHB-248]|uniref:Uncharacterized protein n=1 Tax=Scytonema hofmannii FACHB-248 TaxID=1842502 RepID=A0ABR8GN92_9CYAN|nr:hypothetical protein [Scytonema hofmannii]MBD2604711.1 hypothetical protein [Scytonema hofmannii FACHB-248]